MGGCEYEVKRELNYLVEMRQVNQQRKVGPVAAFEFALLRLATKLTATPAKYTHDYLSSKELARGILPTLKKIVGREVEAHNQCSKIAEDSKQNLVIMLSADTLKEMENTAYCCAKCKAEIPNYYLSGLKDGAVECTTCFSSESKYQLRHRFGNSQMLMNLMSELERVAS